MLRPRPPARPPPRALKHRWRLARVLQAVPSTSAFLSCPRQRHQALRGWGPVLPQELREARRSPSPRPHLPPRSPTCPPSRRRAHLSQVGPDPARTAEPQVGGLVPEPGLQTCRGSQARACIHAVLGGRGEVGDPGSMPSWAGAGPEWGSGLRLRNVLPGLNGESLCTRGSQRPPRAPAWCHLLRTASILGLLYRLVHRWEPPRCLATGG